MAEDGTLAEIINQEIFNELNTKVSNLYNRLSRGRKRIRENMCKQGGLIMKDKYSILNDKPITRSANPTRKKKMRVILFT